MRKHPFIELVLDHDAACNYKTKLSRINNIKSLIDLKTLKHPVEGPLKIEIIIEIARPIKKKKMKYPTIKNKIELTINACLDALNNLVYVDDAQICVLNSSKFYTTTSRVIIRIWKMK